VIHERRDVDPEQALGRVGNVFETIVWVDSLPVARGGKPVAIFHFYRCFGLRL